MTRIVSFCVLLSLLLFGCEGTPPKGQAKAPDAVTQPATPEEVKDTTPNAKSLTLTPATAEGVKTPPKKTPPKKKPKKVKAKPARFWAWLGQGEPLDALMRPHRRRGKLILKAGQFRVTRPVTKQQLGDLMGSNQAAIEACFKDSMAGILGETEIVTVMWTVENTGDVNNAMHLSKRLSKEGRCVEALVKTWTFPSYVGRREASVGVTFYVKRE